MPRLLCLMACGPAGDQYEAGREYHFNEEVAARVMRGSPGSWQVIEGEIRVGGPDEFVDYADPTAAPRRNGRQKAAPTPVTPAAAATGDGDAGDDDDDDGTVDLDQMKIPALRAFASAHGIELTGLRTAIDIRNAIERALESDADEDAGEGDPDAGEDEGAPDGGDDDGDPDDDDEGDPDDDDEGDPDDEDEDEPDADEGEGDPDNE